MSDFLFSAGKKVRKMKREALEFNARPPVWAYWVGGAIVWVLVQAVVKSL